MRSNKLKTKSIYLLTFLLFPLLLFCFSCRQPAKAAQFQILLHDGWHILSSVGLKETGEEFSSHGFDTQNWYPTTVPSTVLAALIKNDVYQDPFFGKNLENIPTEQFKYSWWYRNEFMLEDDHAFSAARLEFDGINYRANIWLNGKKIGTEETIQGAFRMFEIDVTDTLIKGTNTLAVEVIPPKPGEFTIGFVDWNPRPPDENMGLWRPVKLRMSGPVSVNHPFVQSKVDLETLNKARLHISADLINHSNEKVSGVLRGEIGEISFNQPFVLDPHEKKKVAFDPSEYQALTIDHPLLWWPNNLGEPHMHSMRLTASVNGTVSDVQEIRFGIREVSDTIVQGGHRSYAINGKDILIRGGGWTDDMFLDEDPKRIEAQIKYAKHLNLNTLRLEGFWGSSKTLYDLADQYGILLMAGWSCHWEWEDYAGKPVDEFGGIQTAEEMDLISRSLIDQVVWLRNHPSIFVWVLGSDKLPRPELEKKYYADLKDTDLTRPTLAACSTRESTISGPTAVKMNGPYDYVTPNYWYVDKTRGGAFGLNTETGPGPQPPPLESIRRMIPEDHLWPVDDYWDFHCARNEFNTLDRYLHALNSRYGEPQSAADFARVAQVASYEAIRPMFEAFGVNKPETSGIIQWMYNSAWPSMFWQLYDYYLMPGGAFYGAKKGSQPLNIVYNYADKDIYIVNDMPRSFDDLKAEILILNFDSEILLSEDVEVTIGENQSKKILEIPQLEDLSPVYFIDLRVKDATGTTLGRNFYWLSTKEDVLDEKNSTWFFTPNKAFADFKLLKDLPRAQIAASHRFRDLGAEQEIQVTLKNTSQSMAFFIELNVYGSERGHSVLPIYWDDNYISLLPGETREILGRFSKDDLKGETPAFRFSGWNVGSE